MAISYPPGLMDRLRAKGVRFAGDPVPETEQEPDEEQFEEEGEAVETRTDALPPQSLETPISEPDAPTEEAPLPTPVPQAPPEPEPAAPPPPAPVAQAPPPLDPPPSEALLEDFPPIWEDKPDESPGPEIRPNWDPGDDESTTNPESAPPSDEAAEPQDESAPQETPEHTQDMGAAAPKHLPAASRLGSGLGQKLKLWAKRGFFLAIAGSLLGAAAFAAIIGYFSRDLPTLETLANYRPPTVTLVEDHEGKLLGEIYEKRRYVVPLESIPKHVQDAFVASEDAAFWEHAGIDYMGIVRAMFRNVQEMAMAQGASTITQQVARNFLLTSEKKLARKIREAILATRVETAFDKEHILYLYLNQIYLGSGAYGVEAAARVYFDKHVEDLSLAESALLAGLPQRPSD
ncbi:MAG: transglycosylase domain-containing protein, partial [Myxococcota bacterium]|nr:transglycosylase domain-containing protein [Myxococcota bacterium]